MESAGRINEYVCEKCGKSMRTINKVAGVTPFLIQCRPPLPATCDGMATSRIYRCDQSQRPSWEWYKPTDDEIDSIADEDPEIGRQWREHVRNGGLKLRKVRHDTLEEFGFGVRAG